MVTFLFVSQYGTLHFNVRNPELGNTDTLEYTRLSRQSTGGDTIIYRDPAWPKVETFKLTFDLCDQNQIGALKALVQVSLGKTFTYTDHNGVAWKALITNPNTAFTKTARNSETIELELEAERL